MYKSQRTVAPILLLFCLTVRAQDKGAWRAASSTARAITGDIMLSGTKLTINFAGFTIVRARGLEKTEMSAAFNADAGAGGSGNLYRLNVPASKIFLHKNTLCGSDDTQWMATYVSGNELQLAFFSGQNPPVLTLDALASSTDLCGTYAYIK